MAGGGGRGRGTAEGRGRKAGPPPCSLPAPTTLLPFLLPLSTRNRVGFGLFGLVSARVQRHPLRIFKYKGRLGCRGGRSNLLLIVIAPFSNHVHRSVHK